MSDGRPSPSRPSPTRPIPTRPGSGRPGSGRPRAGRRISRAVGVTALAVAAVAALVVALSAVRLLPHLSNPFAETTSVRSQPVLLKSITSLSRYEAASGSFQVVAAQPDRHNAPRLDSRLDGRPAPTALVA